jgi:hypothetical protein
MNLIKSAMVASMIMLVVVSSGCTSKQPKNPLPNGVSKSVALSESVTSIKAKITAQPQNVLSGITDKGFLYKEAKPKVGVTFVIVSINLMPKYTFSIKRDNLAVIKIDGKLYTGLNESPNGGKWMTSNISSGLTLRAGQHKALRYLFAIPDNQQYSAVVKVIDKTYKLIELN